MKSMIKNFVFYVINKTSSVIKSPIPYQNIKIQVIINSQLAKCLTE